MAGDDVLVSTAWAAAHLDDRRVRFLQVDDDELLYDTGHLPGAQPLRWDRDLQATWSRDVAETTALCATLGRLGLGPDTTVVVYGDRSNLWAAYAWWALRLRGHRDVRLMDGGWGRWAAEERPFVTGPPGEPRSAPYPIQATSDLPIRSTRADVEAALATNQVLLVDARSPDHYAGEPYFAVLPPLTGAHRSGRIPGSVNIPWASMLDNDTGLLLSPRQLETTFTDAGVSWDRPVITYCILGAGSAFVHLALAGILGHPAVTNYDGSWLEWGSSVGLPIER